MSRVLLISLLMSLLLGSCSKKENVLGPSDMWRKATAYDPSIELVFLADTEAERSRRVLCSNYQREGCVEGSGKRIKIRLVELLVIQYSTSKQACLAAQAIGQWYAFNWLFDDVTNEPVLEDYVVQAFGAKKPVKKSDCNI